MRWRYDDPPLVWLFVAAFALHVVEEWAGGFTEWFARIAGRPLPLTVFIVINLVGLGLMAAGARVSTRRPSLGWIAIAIATVALINGLAHLLASLAWGTYSPGVITGVVLYLPLSQLLLIRAWQQVPRAFFWRGAIAGAVAHTAVTVTALLASAA